MLTFEVLNPAEGKIAACRGTGCSFTCCNFQRGNFIALYPGELEAARASGLNVGHLAIEGEIESGQRVRCVAGDTSTCDNGYKPLDCASYPFFPSVVSESGAVISVVKGQKCPLLPTQISAHRRWVERIWAELISAVPGVRKWLSQVQLVGYIEVTEESAPLRSLGSGGA